MTVEEPIQLNNSDGEEISDAIVMLGESFGIKYSENAFINVKTFSDLCDTIQAHVIGQHTDDCTTQQAFYKIRTALGATLSTNKAEIKPASRLENILHRKDRRRQVKAFEQQIGFKTDMLTFPDWLVPVFIIGFALSLLAFFIDWRIAVSGIMGFTVAVILACKLGRDLTIQTVGELTEKMTFAHYAGMRRTRGTLNRHEILEMIKASFSTYLDIDRKYLTADAAF